MTSDHFRPVFATRVGFVVTPSRTPQEAASRISSMSAVSRKIFTMNVRRPPIATSGYQRSRSLRTTSWPVEGSSDRTRADLHGARGTTLGRRRPDSSGVLGPTGKFPTPDRGATAMALGSESCFGHGAMPLRPEPARIHDGTG